MAATIVAARQVFGNVDPASQIWKQVEYNTAQTGTNIWTPASGKKLVITSLDVMVGGSTGGLVTIWGAPSGTTTFTPNNTDQTFFKGEFAPNANSKPGALKNPPVPMFSDTVNDCLKITTSAGMTVYITVYGYEI